MSDPILQVDGLVKRYRRGVFNPQETFRLQASFRLEDPGIVGVMGPNGSGKTTLFELITGSNQPSAGTVRVMGRDIHRVKYRQRDRLAIHYHQSYQVRHFRRLIPSLFLGSAGMDYPMVHLFDEPQFNVQDGYIGFMLDFFRRLRDERRLVMLCLHPTEPFHIDILREVCGQFLFVRNGRVGQFPDFASLARTDDAAAYLGRLRESAVA